MASAQPAAIKPALLNSHSPRGLAQQIVSEMLSLTAVYVRYTNTTASATDCALRPGFTVKIRHRI
jgi:hypothetical protein